MYARKCSGTTPVCKSSLSAGIRAGAIGGCMSDINIAMRAFVLMLMILLSLWAGYLITVNVFVYLHDIAHEQEESPALLKQEVKGE
jgi:hypothetical protein